MDRLDRMPGPASQPSGVRGLPDNPAQGRRAVGPPYPTMSNGHPPPPPPPAHSKSGPRKAPSNANLSASKVMTPAQVMALAQQAMQNALESEKNQAADVDAVGPGLRSGVTIDLSRKDIQRLPEEVVDIVKDELERLALSHNQLTSLPARFSECTLLRYLNIRGNQIKEFPMPLCDLKSLEILDLGRNQLRSLPNELSKLSSLKVLSVPKNQIRELPVCLADMVSLQVLKFEGNPVSFPPKDVLRPQNGSPPNDGFPRETDVNEVTMTAYIKKYMKQYAILGRTDPEATGDESSEGAETPRFPLKRAASGRFPIKVNGADVPDIRSPNSGSRPPIVPIRAHSRGLSQQNAATRRPNVMPLTIGNVNERLRSNSETLLRSERTDGRNRRLGLASKKASELGTLDETQANVRFSHYRGLSHGSAMQGAPPRSKSPATPTEPYLQRPVYVRRLSILPERRRESKIFDPVIEAAKGILYSVFQIHPMIQVLMSLTNDGSAKRSSLEIVLYNTNSHVEELEQEIQKHDTADEEVTPIENGNVRRACQTLVSAYGHVCTLLVENIDTFVDDGDARYIRTLLMLLYNSIMELRVTLASITGEHAKARPPNRQADNVGRTIRPYPREQTTTTPKGDRSGFARSRNGTVVHNPANLRVATDVALPYVNGSGQAVMVTSATPRSGESFSSAHSRETGSDFSEDDAQFDRIFLSLQRSADLALRTLPGFQEQLTGGLRNALQQRAPMGMIQDWKSLIAMCNTTVQQTEILRNRLSLVKLKDPGVRTQPSFWNQCNNFVASWTNMAHKIKAAINTIPLPPDTRLRLRPIQQSMKETSNTIVQSPWHHLFRPSGIPGGAYASQVTSPTRAQVPITPLSAALGPAMQATVPTTPHFAAAFHGNVFDRADNLIANPGISMGRNGTMTRGHSGFNSLSSISSMSSDGNTSASSSTFSPNNSLGLLPPRMNGGKVAI
ncbi:hypothetical protein CDD80_4902 [Ophiocordyceps camponoti-rufipedis]|uniref:Disease resistance R13L4/SHOC-2-like LRR domain-containing protein n=1 Tax=Ophiocordyceps camponoti-rufipedis TaxID=2004952 RepID=A0A2C5YYC4_9HYPO|nr:hypothetical protein CDD80_4902 [Ophiocordyceps camponoti-rufipedis]